MAFHGYQWVRKVIHGMVRPPDRVLEIGCGAGYYRLATVRRYIGTDITAEAYRPGLPRKVDLVCDAQHLPFLTASYDLVFSVGVFDLIPDLKLALDESRRVIRPGGRLLVFTYTPEVVSRLRRHHAAHRHALSKDEWVRRFAGSGFKFSLLPPGADSVRALMQWAGGWFPDGRLKQWLIWNPWLVLVGE